MTIRTKPAQHPTIAPLYYFTATWASGASWPIHVEIPPDAESIYVERFDGNPIDSFEIVFKNHAHTFVASFCGYIEIPIEDRGAWILIRRPNGHAMTVESLTIEFRITRRQDDE